VFNEFGIISPCLFDDLFSRNIFARIVVRFYGWYKTTYLVLWSV